MIETEPRYQQADAKRLYYLSMEFLMGRLLGDFYGRRGADDVMRRGAWVPPVDIYEHEGSLVLKAELPGIDPKQVDVRVENNVLTLQGERSFESEVKREQYHRVERAYGTFSRSFTLPNVVDTANIKAEFKDGLLLVTMPKREEAKPKQISIAVTK